MSQRMIADPLAQGAQYQLGNHRATYKPSTMCSILVGFFFFIVGSILTFVFLSFSASIASVFLPIGTAFGLLWAGLTLFIVVSAYQRRMMRVFVYDYGLIHRGQKSQQTIYWRDVRAVWHQVQKHTSTDSDGYSTTTIVHTYTVDCIDGTRLKLDKTFAHLRHLGRSLEIGTAPYIFPGIFHAYQRSQPVVFGLLSVTPQGLWYRAKTLPWTEMKSITIDEYNGRVVIKKQGKLFGWASIELGDLPNVEVFRMLIQHITGVRP
jgi:hypothetical protein